MNTTAPRPDEPQPTAATAAPEAHARADAAPAQRHNPLHGVTLEQLLTDLVAHYGWPDLGQRIAIRCFTSDPSIASSLKFLRKTPWAREKVESLYLFMLRDRARRGETR